MTDATQAPPPNAAKAGPKRAPVSFALYARRVAQLAAIITALFTLYTEGATAYRSTEEAIQIKAAAENAALRQKAEAELAEQKARVQLEDARNSAERLKGEADKAEAEAKKAEFDAQTAAQAAQNAKLKTDAEAKSLSYEVEIRRSKALTELETARVAARKFKAEADSVEQAGKLKLKVLNSVIHDYQLGRCPGGTPVEKINSKDQGRC